MNTVIYEEGRHHYKSALFYLAVSDKGRQLLKDDANLLGKVTKIGLNAVIAEGEYKGTSALFFLAANLKKLTIIKTEGINQKYKTLLFKIVRLWPKNKLVLSGSHRFDMMREEFPPLSLLSFHREVFKRCASVNMTKTGGEIG